MNQRLLVSVLVVGVALFGLPSGPAAGADTITSIAGPSREQQTHIDWVRKIYDRMLTIKPGMTRAQLLEVFESDGGLSTPLKGRFLSRECLYFKVDVEFQAAGRGVNEDRIIRISKPYVEPPVID